ncbi:MAG: C10 family peptidase [Candidatus Cloacimonetes bacterium]|nr:C10 family peptidase [Candidatus Cloacimonadota bacterium]
MNKNKIIINSILLILLLLPLSLLSKTISEYEVKSAVETWVRYVTADARPDAYIEKMEPNIVDGEVVSYIAHLNGRGYCLCGADELSLPVYFYCPKSNYDPRNPGTKYILWEIMARFKNTEQAIAENIPELQKYQKTLKNRKRYWNELTNHKVPDIREYKEIRVAPDSLELGLTSIWNQDTPYNDQCPLHVNAGQRTLTCCVATAMAQIMYYWKWPITGTGTGNVDYNYRWVDGWINEPLAFDPGISNWWTNNNLLDYDNINDLLLMNGNWDYNLYSWAWYIVESPPFTPNQVILYHNALYALYDRLNSNTTNWAADFGATEYEWDLMADNVADLPPGGANAVATISYQAGIALSVDYGLWVSLANTSNVPVVMENNFKYDPDVIYEARDQQKMIDDIQWLRPIEFKGKTAGSNAGHAFVIYGYNDSTLPIQFKMNMGWGGNHDGWYSCNNIFWGGSVHYNTSQYHVLKIAPEDVVKFVGGDDPGDGGPGDPYEDIEEAIAEAPDNSTLIFRAGSNNTFSGNSLEIDRPLVLKGYNAVIQKE